MKYPTGVENHGGKLRIWFVYKGVRVRENLGVPDTAKNRRVAGELRSSVCYAIKTGVFDYAKQFPSSRNLEKFGEARQDLTIKELAEKYNVDIMTMTGFLDGINDSLVEANPIEEMEEDTPVSLKFDKALLYKNMVGAEADWLYGLPQWEKIFDEETRKALYKEQKSSTTIVKEQKIYPNDPCPCGSGKKYKKCCGRNK